MAVSFPFSFFLFPFVLFLGLAFSGKAWGGEEAKKDEPKPAAAPASVPVAPPGTAALPSDAEILALPLFDEPAAGYSMRLPPGYERLSQNESREVSTSLSEYFGQDAGERAMRQPPVYFKGPVDPQRPKSMPPSLVVSCAGAPFTVDPSQTTAYRVQLEQNYSKRGVRHGDITVSVIQVNGVTAIRADHDFYSPIDNSRSHVVMVMVPGPDRRYDIVANFSTWQAESVEAALNIVLKTFKISARPMLDSSARGKWGRIAAWTVGGFVAGVLLSLLLKALSSAGQKKSGNEA